MTTRRNRDRPPHVRRRAPSTGRPTPPKIKLRPGTSVRVASRRRVEPSGRLPIPLQIGLVALLAALGLVTLFTWTGGIGRLVGDFGSSVSALLGSVTFSSTPTPEPAIVTGSPLIASPDEPYTNQTSVSLQITVPSAMVGERDGRVRIYLALEGQAPAPITEVPVGATTRVLVTVALTDGRNDFTATTISSGGESEPSPVVTYILDQEPPSIAITSPKSGTAVSGSTVNIEGKVQARSRLVARNESNGSSTTATAGDDQKFTLTLPLQSGTNKIQITATDPAGNASVLTMTVIRGSGRLSATLAASTYRISAGSLPTSIQLVATVTDPAGKPLAGATVTFSLTLPKIPAITYEATTGGDGRAVFTTTVPKGVDPGSGLASILVTADGQGQTTTQSAITVVR